MRLERAFRSLILSVAIAPCAIGANQVLVVDSGGGPGVYLTPQLAVNAASDGDVILVHPGFYDDLTITAKGLTVVGDGGVPNFQKVIVQQLGPQQTVTLRGFTAQGSLVDELPALTINNCQGCVNIEDAVIKKAAAFGFNVANPSLIVVDSDRVQMNRCDITGRGGSGTTDKYYGIQGGDACATKDSVVALYDCEIRGGDGGDGEVLIFGFVTNSTFGGSGAAINGGLVLFSGCEIRGGQGGDGAETAPGLCDIPASNGGDGVRIFPSGSVKLLDTDVTAGAAGVAAAGCPQANAGDAIEVNSGTAITIPEPARSFDVTSPVREGQVATLSITGKPGEFALAFTSLACLGAPVSGLIGSLLPGPPITAIPLGNLPASGALQIPVLLPSALLPAGCDAIDVYTQVAFAAATPGGGTLSGGSALTIVRAGL